MKMNPREIREEFEEWTKAAVRADPRSYREIAEDIGWNRTSLALWMCSQRGIPEPAHVRLADELGVQAGGLKMRGRR